MIERVAKAIDVVLGDDHESLSIEMGCGSLAKGMRAEAMTIAARAAIEVMRVPTDAMDDAGAVYSDCNSATRTWQAMIAAALNVSSIHPVHDE